MYGLDFHTPLGHHIGRYGRVNAAGQQAHGSAANAGGKTSRAGQRGAVHIGGVIPDLHIHGVFRMVHIHRNAGVGFRQPAADFLRNGDGAHGKLLVGPLGFHLKGFGAVQLIPQILLHGCKNGVQVLFTGAAAADAVHAEDAFTGFPGTFHIRVLILRLHIYRRLQDIHIKITVGLHASADILPKFVLKLALVGTLENDFSQF